MKTIYKTTLSIFLFSVLMVFGANVASAESCIHLYSIGGNTYEFSTTYVGSVPEVDNLSCEETPIDFSHSGDYIYLNPNPGFKITSYSPDPGVEREIRIPRRNFLPGLGFVIINWSGENGPLDNPYTIEYTYKAYDEYGNLLNIDASEIGKATPTSCFGGNFESSTSCSVNPEYRALREGPGIGGGLEVLEDDLGQHDDTGDKYEVFSCPSSNYICPGYGQKITSYEQFPDGIREVVFQRIAKPVGVTVKGVDLIDNPNEEQEKDMTVMSAEGGIPNIQIRWYSENATNCTCTKSTGGGCGIGVSPGIGEYALATGEDGQGNYALTETTTFKVTCDNH